MVSVTTDRRQGINAGTAIKSPVKAASTANLTLSGEQTVDGVALVTDDRILAKDQTTGSENGVYAVNTSTWSREPDFDGRFDIVEGSLIPVNRGTANATTYWRVTNTGSIIIGTTALTFAVTSVLQSAVLQDGSVKMIADFSPNVDATYDLGTALLRWVNAFFSGVLTMGGNIVSDTDSTDDLGTTSVRWANVYTDSIGDTGQATTLKSGQLAFPASQNPSSDVNTLDDYQEGIFTVVFQTTTSGTITIDSALDTLAYTRIGNLCHIQGSITVSSVSSPVGNVNVGNLPFTTATLDESADIFITSVHIINLGTLADGFHRGTIPPGVTNVLLSGSDASNIADDFQATTIVYFNFSYITT